MKGDKAVNQELFVNARLSQFYILIAVVQSLDLHFGFRPTKMFQRIIAPGKAANPAGIAHFVPIFEAFHRSPRFFIDHTAKELYRHTGERNHRSPRTLLLCTDQSGSEAISVVQ